MPTNPPQPPSTRTSRRYALIPAAGVGSRLGGELPKQYLAVAGQLVLWHSLKALLAHPQIEHCFVVVAASDPWIERLDWQSGTQGDQVASVHCPERLSILRCGGASRAQTVANGLEALKGLVADDDWLLVHDAARPGLDAELIDRLLVEVGDDAVGGLLALPLTDTLKREQGGRVETTLPRQGLWLAQTPQMFRYGLLARALATAPEVTDEAAAIEALGLQPRLVAGAIYNLKLTYPNQLALLASWLAANRG